MRGTLIARGELRMSLARSLRARRLVGRRGGGVGGGGGGGGAAPLLQWQLQLHGCPGGHFEDCASKDRISVKAATTRTGMCDVSEGLRARRSAASHCTRTLKIASCSRPMLGSPMEVDAPPLLRLPHTRQLRPALQRASAADARTRAKPLS